MSCQYFILIAHGIFPGVLAYFKNSTFREYGLRLSIKHTRTQLRIRASHTIIPSHTPPLTPSLPPSLRQPEFYDLLNLMISRCCVYLVVFYLEDIALQGEAGRRAEQRCVSYLKFWLSCISERSARGSDATPAPVILVGTHADSIKNVKDLVCVESHIPSSGFISAQAAPTHIRFAITNAVQMGGYD